MVQFHRKPIETLHQLSTEKRWNERKNRVMKKTINVKVFLQYEFNNEKIFLGFL